VALFISEKDVTSLISISDAIEAISAIFRLSGEGKVINPPRQCVNLSEGELRITSAVVPPLGRMGVKVSSSLIFKSNSGRLLILTDTRSGRILALIEVFQLGALRTGAATGVATDFLARPAAGRVGVFGSGRQARMQLLAVASVRPVERVVAISPHRDRLEAFCHEMRDRLRLPVTPAKTPEELYDNDVLISATTAKEPVILGRWLRPGTHINAIGGNVIGRQELDEEAVARCAVVTVVDNKEQAKQESAELVRAVERGMISWEKVREIGDVVAGKNPGRPTPDSITLFKSLGVAMEDVALAARVYELALQRGVGLEIPLTEG
jgi:ornithine cyclodeaminase/alanine dehydrogenase-like protein (mu-crystallin family)